MLKNFERYINVGSLYSIAIRCLCLIFAVMCVIGLGIVLLTSYFGVPMGDDYLAIKTFANSHTWLHEAWYSLLHTGRYMQSVVGSITYGLFESKTGVILPLITLVWTYALTYLFTRLSFTRAHLTISEVQLHLLSSAITLLFVTVGGIVDPHRVLMMYQPFYFSSAIVTYTICVLIYATIFYIYIRFNERLAKRHYISLSIFAILIYLTGLFNETGPATLFGLSVATLVLLFIPYIRNRFRDIPRLRQYLVVIAGSSLLALMTMYFSPASIARRQATVGGIDNQGIIGPAFTKLLTAIGDYTYQPRDIIILFILGVLIYAFLLHNRLDKKAYFKLFLIGGATLAASLLSLLVSITLLVAGYGPYTGLYPRTFLLMQILFVAGGVIGASGLVGLIVSSFSKKSQQAVLLVITVLSLLAFIDAGPRYIAKVTGNLVGVQNYNEVWKQQDATLKNSAATQPKNIVYLDDSGAGIGDGFSVRCNSPFSGSTIWLNDGMEAYYGVREICSKTDLTQPQ